jgi:hypothetical protein
MQEPKQRYSIVKVEQGYKMGTQSSSKPYAELELNCSLTRATKSVCVCVCVCIFKIDMMIVNIYGVPLML